jgi:hypothetical protein
MHGVESVPALPRLSSLLSPLLSTHDQLGRRIKAGLSGPDCAHGNARDVPLRPPACRALSHADRTRRSSEARLRDLLMYNVPTRRRARRPSVRHRRPRRVRFMVIVSGCVRVVRLPGRLPDSFTPLLANLRVGHPRASVLRLRGGQLGGTDERRPRCCTSLLYGRGNGDDLENRRGGGHAAARLRSIFVRYCP